MKKQYIAPSMFSVNLLGIGIIAASDYNTVTDEPSVVLKPGGLEGGDAGGANVKGNSDTWDDEW